MCIDDVLWNGAPETCIILLTSVTPINSIKRKNEEENLKEKGLMDMDNSMVIVGGRGVEMVIEKIQ